jgi:Sulfotransferase domain
LRLRTSDAAGAAALKPNTFLIGAPKCGTTAVARWLAAHPDAFMSDPKEPQYFCRPSLRRFRITTLEAYERLFARADRHTIIAEATTHYMLDETALPAILAYAPEARFLVMLRNPLEMVVSWHGECVRQLRARATSFEDAWTASTTCHRENEPGEGGRNLLVDYVRVCALGSQMERIYSLVSPNRVHVTFLDDLEVAPRAAWLALLGFLGLPDDGREEFLRANVGYVPRRRRLHWFIKDKLPRLRRALRIRNETGVATMLANRIGGRLREEGISQPVRDQMLERFEPEIRLLERLMGRDLTAWRDPFAKAKPPCSAPGSRSFAATEK